MPAHVDLADRQRLRRVGGREQRHVPLVQKLPVQPHGRDAVRHGEARAGRVFAEEGGEQPRRLPGAALACRKHVLFVGVVKAHPRAGDEVGRVGDRPDVAIARGGTGRRAGFARDAYAAARKRRGAAGRGGGGQHAGDEVGAFLRHDTPQRRGEFIDRAAVSIENFLDGVRLNGAAAVGERGVGCRQFRGRYAIGQAAQRQRKIVVAV